MTDSFRALVSLKAFSGKGVAALKETISHLDKLLEIISISSVYKVNRTAESLVGLRDIKREETLAGFSLVLLVKTNLSAENLLKILGRVESDLQREVLRKSISLNLMVYESQIVMLPGLALPHPEMHLRPEEMIPAVEVWPDYCHPVLKVTLLELSRQFIKTDWGEFFTQSDVLLDFSRARE